MLEAMLRVSLLWSLTCYTWMNTHLCCFCLYHDVLPLLHDIFHTIILPWCPIYYCCYHDDGFLYIVATDDCVLHWLLTKVVMISRIHWLGNCMVLCTPIQTCKGLTNVASMWSGLSVLSNQGRSWGMVSRTWFMPSITLHLTVLTFDQR